MRARPAWRWFTLACEIGVVLAFPFRASTLFLVCLAGALVGRGVQRMGVRGVAGIALRLAFAAVVTIVALVAAEYVVRFRYRNAVSGGNARQYIAQARARTHYALNRFGYREREIPAKQPGKYRIAAIGDSFTYGQGIEESERFSNLLEGFLGSTFEVYNFGGPGNNMPEHLDTLDQALTIEPDYVLLQLYINDWEMPGMMRPEAKALLPSAYWDYWFQLHSMVYDLVSNQWSALQQRVGATESYDHYMRRNLGDRNLPMAREAYGLLEQFIERARSEGVGVGVALFPAIDAMTGRPQDYPFRFLHDGARAICDEEGVAFLDLLDNYSQVKDPRTLWASPFDAHPNAVANRRAAYEMLRVFGPDWQQR